MNLEKWEFHLHQWEAFLSRRIESTKDCPEKKGDLIKAIRQLQTLRNVEYAAVLNPHLISEFIEPKEKATPFSPAQYCLGLNESQKRAVQMALGDGALTLIQGPPGTGKTQVIAEICLQLYDQNPNIRILVCSETHVAVNALLSRIKTFNSGLRIVRIRDRERDETVDEYSPGTILKKYKTWLDSVCVDQDVRNALDEVFCADDDQSFEKALALSANIVGMTCNRVAAYSFQSQLEMFDVVIIDEVCKATLPEILIPLTISRKAILVGDPQQLPPVFCTDDRDIIQEINAFDLLQHMHIDQLFSSSKNVTILDTQYRMTKQISAMISEVFYDGQLNDGRNLDKPDSVVWASYHPSQSWPTESQLKTDIYNLDECELIREIINNLEKTLTEGETVSIISPFSAQVRELRRHITGRTLQNVSINTVDAFQGKESDVVIFSLTRTRGPFGFLTDKRRLNVALSRAKNKLIIVGDEEFASNIGILKQIKKKCVVVSSTSVENMLLT